MRWTYTENNVPSSQAINALREGAERAGDMRAAPRGTQVQCLPSRANHFRSRICQDDLNSTRW
jgi:hypothetical protein